MNNLKFKTIKQVSTFKGWYTIGGKKCYFKSKWEVNFAYFMQFLKHTGTIADWDYEPQTFWFNKIKRGVVSYLPDFRCLENNNEFTYYEVKGYMDAKSKTKIKRMAKYYPDIKLVVIGGEWFKRNNKKMGLFIKEWL